MAPSVARGGVCRVNPTHNCIQRRSGVCYQSGRRSIMEIPVPWPPAMVIPAGWPNLEV